MTTRRSTARRCRINQGRTPNILPAFLSLDDVTRESVKLIGGFPLNSAHSRRSRGSLSGLDARVASANVEPRGFDESKPWNSYACRTVADLKASGSRVPDQRLIYC